MLGGAGDPCQEQHQQLVAQDAPAPGLETQSRDCASKKGPVFLNQFCRQLRFVLVKAKQGIAFSPDPDHLSYQSSAGHSFLAAFYFGGAHEAFHKSLLLYRWKHSSTTPESSKVRTCSVLCTTVNVLLPFSAACNPRFHSSWYNTHLHH